jgi:hypothetical protein
MPLIGKTPAEEVLKELVEFAKKKENWFDSFEKSAEAVGARSDKTEVRRPEGGHHGAHVRNITVDLADGRKETYNVVFTITKAQMAKGQDLSNLKDVLLRHATVSVGAMDRFPDEIECFTISRFLGFKQEGLNAQEHPQYPGVVLFEPIPPEEEALLRQK